MLENILCFLIILWSLCSIKYKLYSDWSIKISVSGSHFTSCVHNSEPIDPPAPVIIIFLFLKWCLNSLKFTFTFLSIRSVTDISLKSLRFIRSFKSSLIRGRILVLIFSFSIFFNIFFFCSALKLLIAINISSIFTFEHIQNL